MKIEHIKLSFKPALVQLYFVVSANGLSCGQMGSLLQQISQVAIGSGAIMKNALNNKQKLFIQTVPQKIYNKEGAFLCYAECSKAKINKALQMFSILDQNECRVETCYIVSGAMDLPKTDIKKMDKKLTVCPCEGPDPSTLIPNELQCADKKEVAATVSAYKCCPIKVSGNKVTVYTQKKGGVRIPARAKVERMFKKAQDSLKADFAKVQNLFYLTYGIM